MLKIGGNIIDDPFEVGNVLGQYYSDISSSRNFRPLFRDRVESMIEQMPNYDSDNGEIYNGEFSIHKLQKAVSLSGNTSVGPDMVHYMFFKHMNERQLSEILHMMNYVWCTGNYPKEWRHSIIIPIKKAGKSGEPRFLPPDTAHLLL